MKKILNWLKKWWFSLFCYVAAIFITIYATVYLFIDDYAFVIITHITSGIFIPATFYILLGSSNKPKK